MPGLDDLRSWYIHPKCFNVPSDLRLSLLLSTKNERTFRNFALCLYEAFNRLKNNVLIYSRYQNVYDRLSNVTFYLFVFCVTMVFDFKPVCAV